MSRITTAKCKLCRREGEKLFLKGERCTSPKCAIIKRAYPPGIHGEKPGGRRSEYGRQLREKQKMKRIYGLTEKKFARYFSQASKAEGVTGDNLIKILETRLDVVVQRLGFAVSLNQARQLVNHGLIAVNDKKLDIPSASVAVGDKISFSKQGQQSEYFVNLKKILSGKSTPTRLVLDAKSVSGEIKAQPGRQDIDYSVDTQLIVEYYSK